MRPSTIRALLVVPVLALGIPALITMTGEEFPTKTDISLQKTVEDFEAALKKDDRLLVSRTVKTEAVVVPVEYLTYDEYIRCREAAQRNNTPVDFKGRWDN